MKNLGANEILCQIGGLEQQIEDVAPNPAGLPDPHIPSAVGCVSAFSIPDLLDAVVDADYQGDAWDELTRRLVRRGMKKLTAWIANGTIYPRLARAGYGIARRPQLQRYPYPECIAAEAVEVCLERFRTKVLPRGEWDSARHVELEEFFCSGCLPDVANAWRRYEGSLAETAVPLGGEDPPQPRLLHLVTDTDADPAKLLEVRELLKRKLAPLKDDDRVALVLDGAGWSRAEIAMAFDISVATLNSRVSRARRAAKGKTAK